MQGEPFRRKKGCLDLECGGSRDGKCDRPFGGAPLVEVSRVAAGCPGAFFARRTSRTACRAGESRRPPRRAARREGSASFRSLFRRPLPPPSQSSMEPRSGAETGRDARSPVCSGAATSTCLRFACRKAREEVRRLVGEQIGHTRAPARDASLIRSPLDPPLFPCNQFRCRSANPSSNRLQRSRLASGVRPDR